MIDKKKRTRRKQFHFPLVIGENIKKHTQNLGILSTYKQWERKRKKLHQQSRAHVKINF